MKPVEGSLEGCRRARSCCSTGQEMLFQEKNNEVEERQPGVEEEMFEVSPEQEGEPLNSGCAQLHF